MDSSSPLLKETMLVSLSIFWYIESFLSVLESDYQYSMASFGQMRHIAPVLWIVSPYIRCNSDQITAVCVEVSLVNMCMFLPSIISVEIP